MNGALEQQRAQAMILRRGRMTTITADVPATPNPLADPPSAPGTQSGVFAMAAFPLKRRLIAADSYEQQTEILAHSRQIMLGAFCVPFVPTVGMKVHDWEGSTWTIDGLNPTAPNGCTALLYTGTMRR